MNWFINIILIIMTILLTGCLITLLWDELVWIYKQIMKINLLWTLLFICALFDWMSIVLLIGIIIIDERLKEIV